MLRRWMKGGCVATLLVLAACSDQANEAPTGPQFKPSGGGSSTSCDFNSLQSFITGYFSGNQQSAIISLKNSMASETDAAKRREYGYEIMDSIGTVSRATALSSSVRTSGSNLTKGLIKCMFTVTSTEFPNFPDSSLYSFDLALDAAAGGAYYVRRTTSGTSPVLSVQTTLQGPNTLSGVAPPVGSTWQDVLDETVLFYGWHIPASEEFEWATIRPNAVFDPGAVIALCTGNVPTNTLVHESNIGFLAWQGNGSYICSAPRPAALLESGWGPRSFARRLTRLGGELLLPEPAFATALLSGGTGTAKTLKSRLKLDPLSGAISLAVDIHPKSTEKKNVEFVVRVRATSSAGEGVNGLCILARGSANNGGPAELLGPSNCADPGPKELAQLSETIFLGPGSANPEAGYATFHITIPSPGGMVIGFSEVQTGADNNLTLQVNGTSTRKFNVKP